MLQDAEDLSKEVPESKNNTPEHASNPVGRNNANCNNRGGGSEGVPAGGRMGCRGAVITPLVPPKKRVDTISDTDKTQ